MNASDFAARTMEDNARTNTEALEQLIEEKEKSIIVVMDFYGGIMGSTAFSGSLTHALRQKEGRGALFCTYSITLPLFYLGVHR